MTAADSLRETFEDIAESAIDEADAIDCSMTQLAVGLRTMIDTIKARLAEVEEELRAAATQPADDEDDDPDDEDSDTDD